MKDVRPKLGKSQLALLLIVDEATEQHHGIAFTWEQSLRYVNVEGEHDSFFMMMTRDLRSLERLVNRGLIETRVAGYTTIYSTTDRGRAMVGRLRAAGGHQ